MNPNIRKWFWLTISMVLSAFVLAVAWPRPGLTVHPAICVFALAFLTSCWCNVLLIRDGYVGKSSLVLWVLVSILGIPPFGFLAMLFVLSRSIKNIEVTGRS